MPQELIKYLPVEIRKPINIALPKLKGNLLEIRLRVNQPPELVTTKKNYFIDRQGNLTKKYSKFKLSPKILEQALLILSENSLYALERQLKQGFLTIKGGHRVGFTGKVITENGQIRQLKHFNSINYRIANEVYGAGRNLVKYIYNFHHKRLYNTLVISPPLCGKTTILRDLVRILSTGVPELNIKGSKIGLVDERSEIAGAHKGVPQNNIGPRTDLLDDCPKSEGILLLVRAMSPEIIAVDEIGGKADLEALRVAVNTGVSLLTTIHGDNLKQIKLRPGMKHFFANNCFERFIILSKRKGVGTLEKVLDSKGGIVCGGDS